MPGDSGLKILGKSPRHVLIWDGDPRVLVSAPHGNDYYTDEVAEHVCRILGCRGIALPTWRTPGPGSA